MKANLLKRIITLGATIAVLTPAFTGCGANSSDVEDGKESAAVTASDATVVGQSSGYDGTDPITGEKYPNEIRVGILNGSLIDAIASAEGYYNEFENETGVKISVYYFESGRDVNNAYASNSLDVGTFGSSPISLGTTNNLGYEVVYINDLIGDIEALAVTSDINNSSDLSGKTIATPFASTAHYSLLNYLLANNIEDANVIDLEPQDILAAWQRGDIDGAYVWSPVLGEIKKDGDVLVSSADLAKDGIVTADLTTANIDFAEKYPSLVSGFIDVQNKVYELITNDKDKAINDVEEKLSLSHEEAEEQIDGSVWISLDEETDEEYLGTENSESGLAKTIKSTAEFHVTQGNLDSALELEEYKAVVDSKFVELLLEK